MVKEKAKPAAVTSSEEEIVKTSETTKNDLSEKVMEVPLSDLHSFENHPFKVLDNNSMLDTAESIRQYGVLIPGVVRPRKTGGYEIISGHRRKRACEIAGLKTMPVVVRDIDYDEAVIVLVDSNLQREEVLPSEKAFAYKMKMDAIKRRAGRRKKNSVQVELNNENRQSRDILGQTNGDSGAQVSRYIRLTNLVPELLSKVDRKLIAFNPAVELSYLRDEEQLNLLEAIALVEASPSLSQAQTLKKLSQNGSLTFEVIESILSEEKKDTERFIIKGEQLKKYFPKVYTPRQIENIIINLLEEWAKKQKKN